jgi:hypothetical protein
MDQQSLLVCDPNSDLIPVPTIALCPDCFAGLFATPNEFQGAVSGINLYKISVPTIYCRHSDDHGSATTEDWFENIRRRCRVV